MVQLVTPLRRLAAIVATGLLFGLAGCDRQPDALSVREVMQQQIDAALGNGVLQIDAFRRAGSQPLSDPPGRLVYFNAQMKLLRDYDFTQWDAHNVATLASLLGAGAKGVFGLNADGNRAGDLIGVYGSAAFAVEPGRRWTLLPSAPPPELADLDQPAAAGASVRPQARESPLPTAAELAMQRLESLLDATPANATLSPAQRQAIVTQEIEAAYRTAQARLARAADTLVLAGGPDDGAYAEVAQSLARRASKAGIALEALDSDGSVANIRLLADGLAQFALVQNDVAAAAFAGRGRFGGAAQPELRALASLFPEAVQLVVRADSPIRAIADLQGKRVDLGLPGSGSRANALAILSANGISLDALAESSGHGLGEATALLAAGKIDALFTTVHAPAHTLQSLAARLPLRWIDLLPTDALREGGLVPLRLPARTYARQAEAVQTLAATALMVTLADVPQPRTEQMLGLLFGSAAPPRAEGSAAAQIHRRTAREGVLIPWAAGAEAFLDTKPSR